MEALTRLVSESLARHGFDRPLDYRRLHWSRWFRCESHHSLLFVPSKPGVFAVAEEIVDLGTSNAHAASDSHLVSSTHVVTDASPVPRSEASGPEGDRVSIRLQTPEAGSRRMLAVTQFFEDDDMAFVLDRMLSRENPMRARLTSGRYFIRFVTIEDQFQRRSICAALNQWVANSAEKISGIGSHFATSLELTPATEYVARPNDAQQSLFANATDAHVATSAHATDASPVPRALSEAKESGAAGEPVFSRTFPAAPPHLDSGAATNIHCPSPLPSGF
jgi:hypothetical protein